MQLIRNQIFTFPFKIFTLAKEKSRNDHNRGHFTDVGSQTRLGGRFIGLAGDLGLGGRSGPLAGDLPPFGGRWQVATLERSGITGMKCGPCDETANRSKNRRMISIEESIAVWYSKWINGYEESSGKRKGDYKETKRIRQTRDARKFLFQLSKQHVRGESHNSVDFTACLHRQSIYSSNFTVH